MHHQLIPHLLPSSLPPPLAPPHLHLPTPPLLVHFITEEEEGEGEGEGGSRGVRCHHRRHHRIIAHAARLIPRHLQRERLLLSLLPPLLLPFAPSPAQQADTHTRTSCGQDLKDFIHPSCIFSAWFYLLLQDTTMCYVCKLSLCTMYFSLSTHCLH